MSKIGFPAFLFALIAVPALAEVVYQGLPLRKLESNGIQANMTDVPDKKRKEFEVRIAKVGDRYLWVSRGGKELIPSVSGKWLILHEKEGAGFIKLVDPVLESARAPLRETHPAEKFDYVECIHQHEVILCYWGRGTGKPHLK